MKTLMTQAVVLLVLLNLCSMPLLAGNNQRIGGAGAQELLIPVGARGVALGGANLIFAAGPEAIYWNPAGLSRMDHDVEAIFSHMSYFADINVEYGALAVKAGDFGTLGFSLKTIGFGDIPVTTEDFPDGTGEQYSPTFVNLNASFSKLLSDRVSVGVGTTVIAEKIMSTSASGIGFSVGIQYYGLGIPELNLAVAVKNVGPNMTFDGPNLLRSAAAAGGQRGDQNYSVKAASFQLPSSMEIGLGYTRKLDEKNNFLIGGNFQNNNSSHDVYGIGAEYSYDATLFLRGSYLTAPQAADDPADKSKSTYAYDYTIGAGIRQDVGGVDITFDYAYRHIKTLSSNNIITLKLGF